MKATSRGACVGLRAAFVLLTGCWAVVAGAATVALGATDKNGGGLDQTVFYLEKKDGSRPAGHAPLEAAVAQQGMQFNPYVTVVGVGAKVTFPNLDGVPHHLKSYSPAKQFEFKISEDTPPPITLDQPGVIVLNCLIHDWMRGYIMVVDTPWYAITGPAGTSLISDVPPGAYVAYAWHPDLGNFFPPLMQDVTVTADGGKAAFSFPFAPRPKKKMHPL